MTSKKFLTTFCRGLRHLCPQCGQSVLYHKYLKVKPSCEQCHLDFETIRSDDAPAYFTIAILGHLLIPFIVWVEINMQPPLWVHLGVWPVLVILGVLASLPRVKGAVMAVIWMTK